MSAPSINTCKNLNRHNSVTLDRNVRKQQKKKMSPFRNGNRIHHHFANKSMPYVII